MRAVGLLDECAGQSDFAACTLATGAAGSCYATTNGHACMPGGCGNGIVDPDEVCDDGNAVVGDGCSDSCKSNETCGNGIVDPASGELCDDGNVQSHDGCAHDCVAAEAAAWTQVPTGALAQPPQRAGAAMAFDPISARTIVFGGSDTSVVPPFYGDTWAYDGKTWTQLEVTGPAARTGAQMVYDRARNRLVMFGGDVFASTGVSTIYNFYEDTWEWDGASWHVVTSSDQPHPTGRTGHAMAYDPVRKRVVVYGGVHHLPFSLTDYNDTWEWDGASWTQGPDGPGANEGATMAFDPTSGKMILVGGNIGTQTWAYDGTTWTQLSPATSPPARTDGAMTTDPKTGHLILFGGSGLSDAWSWDGQTWKSAPLGPNNTSSAGFTMDVDRRRAVLFGGFDATSGGATNATWEWDGTSWAMIAPTNASALRNQATAYDSLRGRAVIFGGNATKNPRTGNTLIEIDDGRFITPVITGTKPTARASAGMAYDVDRRVTLMFGGNSSVSLDTPVATALGDTWTWDGTAWTPQTTGTQPAARTMAALAYDAAHAQVVMFGGTDTTDTWLAETWLWNGTWTQAHPATSPPAREGAALAYDPVHRQTVLFGGDNNQAVSDDTWVWDGTTWTQIVTSLAPLPRTNATMAWSPDRERLILFGGHDSVVSATADTWEWDGATWTPLSLASAPPPRGGASMFPTRDGKGLALYAGVVGESQDTARSDLWTLEWSSPTISDDNCVDQSDSDGDGNVGCADNDCWATCTPACDPGTTCDAAAPQCGDGVCNTFLETCLSCPGDCTCTPLCGDFRCDPGESCIGDCM